MKYLIFQTKFSVFPLMRLLSVPGSHGTFNLLKGLMVMLVHHYFGPNAQCLA